MISTSPKRLRTTAWTINKNKKSQKAEGGKGRNFSASAFSNEGRLFAAGREHMAQKRRGKMTRKQRQRQLHRRMFLTGVLVVLICVGIYSGIRRVAKTEPAMSDALADGSSTQGGLLADDYEDNDITDWTGAPPIDMELLTPNSWSRPQTRLKKVNGIVIHYTANPGSTAMQNRDYFENLPETQEAQASSHFVIGIEGEVVQCIPTSEWSYASNQRNFDTISIECCHPDESGEFTDETFNSVVQLAGFLCKRFNLTSDDVIRHYDVTEKLCPLYYVEHEDAWIQMKADIQAYADSLS